MWPSQLSLYLRFVFSEFMVIFGNFKTTMIKKQAELGVPHSKSKLSGPDPNVIYVSLRSDKQMLRSKPSKLRWWVGGWVGFLQEIIPLLGSILQTV